MFLTKALNYGIRQKLRKNFFLRFYTILNQILLQLDLNDDQVSILFISISTEKFWNKFTSCEIAPKKLLTNI
jgi:hypothetical protein